MRVVQVNAVFPYGSTGRVVQAIDKMICENNGESWIACASGKSERENVIHIGNPIDRKMHALFSHLTGLQGYFSRLATHRLIRRMKIIQPDIIHLHNLHHNYVNLKRLLEYCNRSNIKIVITLHDCWFFTGKCTHFKSVGCEKWKSGCHECPQLRKDNPSWFFDTTKKMWKDKRMLYFNSENLYVVGTSEWITDLARVSILNTARVLVTIHNGVGTEVFRPDGNDLRNSLNLKNKFVILCMANKMLLDENRGLLEFICHHTEKEVMILMLGSEIRSDRIIGLPYVSKQEEMATIYRTADVFINVTHEDTLPTVNLEAMACGTPIITYDVCGSTETVVDSTGICVEEDDWDGLLKAIGIVRARGKDRYKAACVDHIRKNYNIANCYKKYLEIYNK